MTCKHLIETEEMIAGSMQKFYECGLKHISKETQAKIAKTHQELGIQLGSVVGFGCPCVNKERWDECPYFE